MSKTIRISDKLAEQINQYEGHNYTERIKNWAKNQSEDPQSFERKWMQVAERKLRSEAFR